MVFNVSVKMDITGIRLILNVKFAIIPVKPVTIRLQNVIVVKTENF